MSDAADRRVFLTGYLDVPSDHLDRVRQTLPLHVELTLAEAGCLSFEVVEDPSIAGRFNVSEVFVDQAAFHAHQARTKASDWFRITRSIPRHYSVTGGSRSGD